MRMNQLQIEKIVRKVLAEELGEHPVNTDNNISPLLKEIRDSVQEKMGEKESNSISSTIEDIKIDVEKSMN